MPRIEILQVLTDHRCSGHPVIVCLLELGAIKPGGMRFEPGPVRRKGDPYPPGSSGSQIHGPHRAAYAAIVMLPDDIIDHGCGGRGVADHAKIEFNTPRSPGSALTQVPVFDNLILVDILLSG